MRTLITRLPLAVLLIPSPIFLRTTASRTFATMSTTNPSSKTPEVAHDTTPQNNANVDHQQQQPKAPLALPAAPSSSDPITNLDMSNGSTTVSLDHLGPMVVNVDGTMSRISNWDKMAEIEKKNTLRIIGKRNKSRLEALKQKAGAAGAEGAEGEA
jgi:hypothetical protein